MPDKQFRSTTGKNFRIAAQEPPPFSVLNPQSTKPLILVCDHASRKIPACLGDMGLDPLTRRCHLAWDIGAGNLTRELAARLGATAVLGGYSRLVLDCNRELTDLSAFLEFGDGVAIPGNVGISDAEKAARAQALFWPYHHAIENEVRRLATTGKKPLMLAIHSFTPVLDGVSRRWQIGVLWDVDSRVSSMLLSRLRQAGYEVGDNQPYSGRAPQDFTIDHHAEGGGLPHAELEIRQDQILQASGVRKVAEVLAPVITEVMEALIAPGRRIPA